MSGDAVSPFFSFFFLFFLVLFSLELHEDGDECLLTVECSLAWAELYLCIATLAQHFDLEFPSHTAEDFEASIDSFVILTKSRGELRTVAKVRG